MVGQMVWEASRGRGKMEEAELGPLRVLRWTVRAPKELAPWRLERRLHRAERALTAAGVGRVLLGPDFPWAGRLRRLKPVDPVPLWRGAADVLALGALEAENVPPNRGRVALSAPRLCPELEEAARRLCPRVRGLLIDVPCGEDFARSLQCRYGLPVTPPSAGADVTAAFGPGGGRWGRCVELYAGGTLGGLALGAEGVEAPEGYGDQVLTLLWEQGGIKWEKLCCELIDKTWAVE